MSVASPSVTATWVSNWHTGICGLTTTSSQAWMWERPTSPARDQSVEAASADVAQDGGTSRANTYGLPQAIERGRSEHGSVLRSSRTRQESSVPALASPTSVSGEAVTVPQVQPVTGAPLWRVSALASPVGVSLVLPSRASAGATRLKDAKGTACAVPGAS